MKKRNNSANKSRALGSQNKEVWSQFKERGSSILWARDGACMVSFGKVLGDFSVFILELIKSADRK